MRKKKQTQFSQIIQEFCAFLEAAQKNYTWSFNQVHEMELITQDYLHQLELGCLNYKERAKVATKLAECRKSRREHKDTVHILEPLVQYLDSEKGKQLYNMLREVLGKTRKVEERMENRVYTPRVLDSEMESNDKTED